MNKPKPRQGQQKKAPKTRQNSSASARDRDGVRPDFIDNTDLMDTDVQAETTEDLIVETEAPAPMSETVSIVPAPEKREQKTNAIRSMTGFAKAEARSGNMCVTVEVKSVNGRFLETTVRLPKNLNAREFEIREAVRRHINRGSVSVNVSVDSPSEAGEILFNEELAVRLYESLNSLKKRLKITAAVRLEDVLALSDLVVETSKPEPSEQIWELTSQAVEKALNDLDGMRRNEGSELANDIFKRVRSIETNLVHIEELAVKRVPHERERLRQRIAQLFENDEIDEQRLQLEIVLLADKLDISEECVRMRSHIRQFHEIMRSNDSVGRRINFLLQELNREINTIGSKANDAEISHIVVNCKEELERVREQIQNIE